MQAWSLLPPQRDCAILLLWPANSGTMRKTLSQISLFGPGGAVNVLHADHEWSSAPRPRQTSLRHTGSTHRLSCPTSASSCLCNAALLKGFDHQLLVVCFELCETGQLLSAPNVAQHLVCHTPPAAQVQVSGPAGTAPLSAPLQLCKLRLSDHCCNVLGWTQQAAQCCWKRLSWCHRQA